MECSIYTHRLAGMPTSFSPLSVKATTDGVVRLPSLFSITIGFSPSITATVSDVWRRIPRRSKEEKRKINVSVGGVCVALGGMLQSAKIISKCFVKRKCKSVGDVVMPTEEQR